MVNSNTQKSQVSRKRDQKGVVLIVALVFLIALTAVAAALMQNTTTDIKMAGASQEKLIVTQETISEMDRVIFNEINRITVDGAGNFINTFAQDINFFSVPRPLVVTQPLITVSSVTAANQFRLETDCPAMSNGSSSDLFACNVLRVVVNRAYGRDNNSNIGVNAGINQQLLKKVN